jgi:hypothetical protein
MAQQSDTEPRPAPKTQGRATSSGAPFVFHRRQDSPKLNDVLGRVPAGNACSIR